MLQAKLIVVGGEVKTQEVKLKLPTVIGRGKEANLKVPLALVSRRHCEIRERDGRLFIRDLGSLNGTFVNNYKITSEQPLLPGELITIGTVTFRADYQLSPKQLAEAERSLSSNSKSTEKPSQPSRSVADQVVFTPVVAERPTSRIPSKKTPTAAVSLDATVAGTMSVTVSPGNPLQLNDTTNSATPKAQVAPTPAATAPTRAKPDPVRRETIAAPSLPAARGNQVRDEKHNVLDEFPLETTAQKSISLSALEELPFNAPRQVSFIGDLNFGGAVPAEPTSEPVRIDLGKTDAVVPTTDGSADAQLDSFLRRIAQPSD